MINITETESYLRDIKLSRSPATLKAYSDHIEQFREWMGTAMPGETRIQLLEFRQYLIDHYRSPKSMNLALAVIRGYMKFLLEREIVDRDYSIVLRNVKESILPVRAALSREQIATIFDHLKNSKDRQAKRNYVMFLLLITTGIRRNELTNLKIDDVGMRSGRNCLYILRKDTVAKDNFVIIQDEVYKMLKEFIGDREEGYVFLGERTGDKMNPDSVSRLIKKLFRDCGYDDKLLSLHSTRHSFCILALEGGASLTNLSRSLNHKNLSTTARYLTSFDRMNDAAEDCVSISY